MGKIREQIEASQRLIKRIEEALADAERKCKLKARFDGPGAQQARSWRDYCRLSLDQAQENLSRLTGLH